MNGRVAGRFTELRRLGEGGMGSVSLAHDHATGAACALKRVHIADDAEAVARLQSEFAALSKVRHPALVEVRDLVFERGASPVLVMEFVPGLPADQVVPVGDIDMLVRVALRAAEGLAALHDAGVVHGDIKPANLLVSPEAPDDVRLVDLGLASLAGHVRPSFAGTPGYAANELRRGEPATVATDLFALGATLHALLTGALPHASRSDELSSKNDEPPSDSRALERAGAPPALVALILQLMASAPAERPRDARAVVRELTRLTPSARPSLSARLDTARFVGRERDVERVLAAHRRSARAPGRVLVSGEPGMGKSALLDAVATRLRGEGVCVALVPASAMVLHTLAVTLAAAAGSEPLASRSIREWLEEPDRTLAPDELEQVLRWMATCAATIARAGRPAAILVDDFDRLDGATRAALRRLALADDCRALHAWAADRIDAPTAQLVDAGELQRITLRALDADDRRQLVAARLGAPAPASLMIDLDRHAEGSPGRMLARLRAVVAAGAVADRDEGLVVSDEALLALLPSAVDAQGFESRWTGVAAAESVVLALALSPRPLDASTLLRLIAPADGATLAALIERGVVREVDGRHLLDSPALAESWAAKRPPEESRAMQRALLAESSFAPVERFRLLIALGEHVQALDLADAIAESGGGAAIARDAARAADHVSDPRACTWHLRAAREARRTGRYVQAARSYGDAAKSARGEEALEALEGELVANARVGHVEGLLAATERALATAPPPRWRAGFLLLRANFELGRRDEGAILSMLAQARTAAETAGSTEILAQVGLQTGQTLAFLGRDAEALAVADETLSRCSGLVDASVLRLEGVAGRALHRLGRSVEGFERMTRAQRKAIERGELFAQADTLALEANARMEHGDWTAALALHEASFRLALALDLPRSAAVAAVNRLVAAALTGDLRSFARLLPRIRRLTQRWSRQAALVLEGQVVAIAELGRGRPARARQRLERALGDPQVREEANTRRWTLLTLAQAEEECGAPEKALGVLEELLHESYDDVVHALALARRGMLRLQIGSVADSERDLQTLGAVGAVRWRHAEAHVAALRAALAVHRSSAVEVDSMVADMVDRFAALPAPHEMAMALMTITDIALQQQRSEVSGALWIEQARERAERLGNAQAQIQALELRERWTRLTTPVFQASEDMTWLAEVSILVQHIGHLPSLAQSAMAIVCRRLESERGVLVLKDRVGPGPRAADRAPFQVVATYGAVDDDARRQALGFSSKVVNDVMRSGQGIRNSNVTRDPQMVSKSLMDMRVRSVLCEPLVVGGGAIGAVYLHDRSRPRDFSIQDSMRLQAFARIMAVAIEQSWLQAASQLELDRVVTENVILKQRTGARFESSMLVGAHESMQRVNELIERVAHRDSMVLITGASGTGKELVARSIHAKSPRRDGPFISINCGALVDTMIESELFGIMSDVATGVTGRPGKFEHAHGGTLFLDEIAEMPMAQQVKLLRVLQTREVTPVGGIASIPVDVRVIAATNRDLPQLIEEGRFRSDLYYRINVVPIQLPRLSERTSDLPALAQHLAAQIAVRFERRPPRLSARFLDALLQHDWPGNVRELENYIERMMLMETGDVLEPVFPPRAPLASSPDSAAPSLAVPLEQLLERVRRERILAALESCAGNQSRAARLLDIGEPKLRFWMKKLGIRLTRSF